MSNYNIPIHGTKVDSTKVESNMCNQDPSFIVIYHTSVILTGPASLRIIAKYADS